MAHIGAQSLLNNSKLPSQFSDCSSAMHLSASPLRKDGQRKRCQAHKTIPRRLQKPRRPRKGNKDSQRIDHSLFERKLISVCTPVRLLVRLSVGGFVRLPIRPSICPCLLSFQSSSAFTETRRKCLFFQSAHTCLCASSSCFVFVFW